MIGLKRIIRERRGIALPAIIFMMIFAALVVSVATSALLNFANFVAAYETSARSRYLCECGVERGVWLVVFGHGPGILPAAGQTKDFESLVIGTETVTVRLSLSDAGDEYTIIATHGDKKVTARYLDQKIIEWKEERNG